MARASLGGRRDRGPAAALLAAALLAGCAENGGEPAAVFTGPTMGTTYTVKLAAVPQDWDRAAMAAGIERVLGRVDQRMSTYLEDSELSRFNRSPATDWVPASAELAAVIGAALATSELSGGAFDVTVGPLVNLWGFGPGERREDEPGEAEIEAARARVGYRAVQLRRDPPRLRKARPGVYVDLSAIAKGYAVDRVAEYLEARGAGRYLAEVGGELRAKGDSHRGTPWRIAIERPVTGGREVQTVVELTDGAVATSGDYRNYFESNGVRYSHTIDPRTGRPIAHRLASVTVVDDSAMRADALATALLVLGPDDGLALAEREDIAALFVVKDADGFQERRSTALQRYLNR